MTNERIALRMAQLADVAGIVALVNGYASNNVMLPLTADRVALALDDFIIAVTGRERMLACGALKEYSPSLAEIASVAVAPEAQGTGLGKRIVGELEALARVRGIHELFALTMTAGFFESAGYTITERARYPEKVRRDCTTCARRFGCSEVCVSRILKTEMIGRAA